MQISKVAVSVAVVLFGSLLAQAQTPTPTRVDSNIAVDSFAQGNCPMPGQTPGTTGCGGCYPDSLIPDSLGLSQLPKVNPEWSPINLMIPGADSSVPPNANTTLITGTVGLSKSPGDDFPGSHVTSDYNTELIPDSNGFLATGNTNNRVEFEWEGDKFPLYAWPDDGDRMTVAGRWIFDCGHPDPGPLGECSGNGSTECVLDSDCVGTCKSGHCSNNASVACSADANCSFGTCTSPPSLFNYQSELHPPHAVAVIRPKSLPASHKGRTAPAIPATRADVFIGADGGGAGDRCVVTHLTSPSDVLFTKSCFINQCSVTARSCRIDKDCPPHETCITLDPNNRLANINAANFEFDMLLPPPPSGTATLKIVTKKHPQKGAVMPKAIFQPTMAPTPNLHVIIPMATPVGNKTPNLYAASISAGWKEDTAALTHVQVQLNGITINNPLKDSIPAVSHVCTNNENTHLTSIKCSTNADCPAGACPSNNAPCHTDADCPKTDACGNGASGAPPSQCVGGIVPGWDIWSEVNGDWVRFANLGTIGAQAPFTAPPYLVPSPTPLVINEKFKFDEFVPPTGAIHIRTNGHSFNCLTTMFSNDLKTELAIYDTGPGAACLSAGTRSPGEVDITQTVADLTAPTPVFPAGVACTPASKAGTFNCTVTSSGGTGGTCSNTPTKLCVSDRDCPGTCSDPSAGPCSTASDCKHCSGSTTTFCRDDSDCPTGTCSNDPTRPCHVNHDCKSGGTCSSSAQNCVASSLATCSSPDECKGTCSNSPSTPCHDDGDCTGGNCQFGGFTLQYTIAVIP